MSAFLVDKQTIDNMVHFMTKSRKAPSHSWLAYKFGVANPTTLGQILWNMNQDAVNQRYRENNKAPEYEFSPNYYLKPITTYKSFNCFLYQCSEGDVYESDEFKTVEKIRNVLADSIIESIPGYDEAPEQ